MFKVKNYTFLKNKIHLFDFYGSNIAQKVKITIKNGRVLQLIRLNGDNQSEHLI